MAPFIPLRGCATIVRVRRVVVPLRAIMRVLVTLLTGAILVMPEGHALPRSDSSHALDRDGQG